jgi:mannosyltransferase
MTTTTPTTTTRPAGTAASSRRPRASSIGVPLALGLVGTAVALVGSSTVSLWTDEAATVSAATRSLPELWALVQRIDAVHAAYYLVMHLWTSVAGVSPLALRLPSAIAVGVSVVGVHRLLVVLGRPDAAVIGAVVAAVLPRITWMGIEARSFGPSAAFAVWATVLLVVALRRGGAGRWVGYAALLGIGTALNIYVALLAIAHAVTVVVARDVTIRRRLAWLVAAAGGGLAASPVVLLAAGQQGQLGDNRLGLVQIVRGVVVNQWFLGGTPTRVTSTASPTEPWALASLGLALVGWALIVLAVVAGRRRDGRQALFALVPVLVVPTVVVVAYSLAVSPLYNPRYFTFAAPVCAALVGLGVLALRRRAARVVAVVAIVLLCAPVYVSQRQVTGKSGTDWAEAAAVVDRGSAPGDGVYFAPLDPGTTTIVRRSTDNVEVTYPAAFEGLVDVTRRSDALDQDSLRGTSWSLGSDRSRLADVDRLWVVEPADPPTGLEDDEVLSGEGFVRVSRWSGGMTAVEEWARP